jgi:hypothetical protein
MKQAFQVRCAGLVALACALTLGAPASAEEQTESAPVAGMRPALNTLDAQPDLAASQGDAQPPGAAAAEAQGNVAELMQLIRDAKLNELRTTYNGSYGASLFFHALELTYYVALFQDKHFWRVIKSQDRQRSEAIYAGFVQQTAQLADIEIHRTELQAQNAFLERVIALQADRAKRLEADLDVARTRQAQVADQQRQVRGEAAALQAEKDSAQARLRELQHQVQQLQLKADAGLPGAK